MPNHVTILEATDPFRAEIATAFQLHSMVAENVRAAVGAGRFPLVLSGNCSAAIGTVAGIPADPVGIIWFDAHGDFNTPETTTSGFLDGMGLATLAGACWKTLAALVPGFRPVRGENILHIGGRDVSPAELDNMTERGVQTCSAAALRENSGQNEMMEALQCLRERAANVYVHLDLDAIDPSEARANEFSLPGGLFVDALSAILRTIHDMFSVSALGIASYDPAQDREGRTVRATAQLLRESFRVSSLRPN